MANRKISDLTALTAPVTGDLLPIVDISEAAAANKNKKITYGTFLSSVPLGTAAAPSIAFTGDSNTGIYSPGADQLAVATNGTGRLIVLSNGNVGIGTSAPGSKFDVNGSAVDFDAARFLNTNSDGGVATSSAIKLGITNTAGERYARIQATEIGGNNNNVSLDFYTNSSASSTGETIKMRIEHSGNVGIGTTSPGAALEINAAAATSPFIAKINTAEAARIDTSGRLLVGGSPDSGGALLQVFGDRIRVGTAKTPASASGTGTAGEICWDASYIYVCTATNTWKRTAIATW